MEGSIEKIDAKLCMPRKLNYANLCIMLNYVYQKNYAEKVSRSRLTHMTATNTNLIWCVATKTKFIFGQKGKLTKTSTRILRRKSKYN